MGIGGWYALERVARPPTPDGPLSDAAQALMARAWKGLDPARVLDSHVHVVGLGIGDTGCSVNDRMRSWLHPVARVRFAVYRRAAGITDLSRADQQYLQRLAALARQYTPHGKLLALAFDHAYRDDGSLDEDASEFYVPNDYVLAVRDEHPDVFEACASIHPYRSDAVAELESVAAKGAKCIKWLPSAMRIDPASDKCDAFFDALARLGIPLLTHAGEERAVDVEDAQKLCNPLRLRRPLRAGVKVIVCHCASSGDGVDEDEGSGPTAGAAAKWVPNLDLFLRLMDEKAWDGLLFGDISALTQFNRCGALARLLQRTDLHHRLINGSDYPMPAINVLAQTGKLESLGILSPAERQALNEIDRHNPLIFDFVMKRTARGPGGERFPDHVFMPPKGLFPAA
jgi:hypothetical protein